MKKSLRTYHSKMSYEIYNHTLSFFFLPILFAYFLYKCFIKNPKKPQNLPPSPPKLPIIGHLHKLGMLPHLSLQSLSIQFGEIMLIYLGNKPAIVISSSKIANEIIKKHDLVISNRPDSTVLNKLFYNRRDVAFASYGEHWRQMRSILTLQLLSNTRVRSYRKFREEEIDVLMEKIEKNGGLEVDLSSNFMVFANDLICKVVFGRKYNGNTEKGVDFEDVLRQFMEVIGVFYIGDYVDWLGWVNRFSGLDERLERISKRFDGILEEFIRDHEKKDLEKVKDGDETKDFLDILLEIEKENLPNFTLERACIKALILDIFLASTETTSTMLEWTMTELLRNPSVMQELQNEVRTITQEKEKVSEDDLEGMEYLKAVIKESLRLHPPGPLLLQRQSTQDINIYGYDIPANSRIIFNAWTIHRQELSWEKPEEFRPNRFLNSPINFIDHNCELISFGLGRRICPGLQFANHTIELVLANLVNKFNWKLPDGIDRKTLNMSHCPGITIHRKVHLLAIANPHYHKLA